MNPIKLVDLKVQLASIRREIDSAIDNIFDRCDFILGSEVESFEEEFSRFCNVKYAVGCANGTDAIELALRALEIGEGDEVILPAMTYIATAAAVTLVGAKPVLVDVNWQTGLIDSSTIEDVITSSTKAIIVVHLYGQCADMDAVNNIANKHNLYVIEDAAQAHGAKLNGKRAGSMGVMGCFSFYPGKNLGAMGDGGMVTCSNKEIDKQLRLLRNLGSTKKYYHEVVGRNSRLDTMQAAILRIKLKYLDQWNNARTVHAEKYAEILSRCPGIELTNYHEGSVYHLYVIRHPQRVDLLARLHAENIEAAIHYPFAVHQLEAYRGLGYVNGSFPSSEYWASNCLTLPMYPELSSSDMERITSVINDFQSSKDNFD